MLAKDGRRSIPIALVSDQELVALDDLAAAFQLTVREEAQGAITVTYKGKALPGGTVIFVTEDNLKQDRVQIKPDGTYSSSTVPLGNLRVAVEPAPKGVSGNMPKGVKKPEMPADSPASKVYGQSGADYVDIPQPLRDPATSKITLKVESGVQTFDIPLKDSK